MSRPRALPVAALAAALTLLAGQPLAASSATPATAAVPAVAPAPLPPGLADLDAYVAQVQATFQVPGVAIAVVKDGRPVLVRGYGVRELGGKPVDGDTLFAIASITKAFTATALNLLAEDGKLSLDDRVIDHLPWFRMADPYVTREMRLRDLLAHRSGLGLGAGDLLYWPGTDLTTEEVARRLAHVPLAGSFRDGYAYDNILYAVAQLVVERASGQTFEQFLQARIFTPLRMDDVRFNSDRLRPRDNVATGYALADGKTLVPAPRLAWSNASGAGGLYASANDMAKWLQLQLAGGVYRDAQGTEQRLFPEARQQQMWSMITPIGIPRPSVPELAPARPQFLGYGQGWMLSDYRGEKLVWHTGGWPGMVSRLTLVPNRGLGVVVMTSGEFGGAFNAITLRVLDAYLGAPATDWNAAYGAALAKSRGGADQDWAKHVAARDATSRPSLPLARYAATYRDPWYGDVRITHADGALRMVFSRTPQLVGRLEHWQHDTFIVRWDERWLNADAFVTFALDHDGKVVKVSMEAISPNTDFSFDFHDLALVPATP